MKTFIVTYEHNYGLGVTVINANSEVEAREMADAYEAVWDGYDIEEVDLITKGSVFTA